MPASVGATGAVGATLGQVDTGEDQKDPPVSLGLSGHLSRYLSSAEGATDLLDVVQTAAQHIQNLPLSDHHQRALANIQSSAGEAWQFLGLADAIGGGVELCAKTGELITLMQLPSDNPKTQEIPELAKKVLLQGSFVTYSSTKALSLFQAKKWVDLGSDAPRWISGINNVSALIMDGFDLYDQSTAIHEIQLKRAQATQVEEIADLDAQAWLCLVKLVKDVASLLLSIIVLTTLIFEIVVESIVILPPILLTLATIFLITKIYGYFYERLLEESPLRAQRRALGFA